MYQRQTDYEASFGAHPTSWDYARHHSILKPRSKISDHIPPIQPSPSYSTFTIDPLLSPPKLEDSNITLVIVPLSNMWSDSIWYIGYVPTDCVYISLSLSRDGLVFDVTHLQSNLQNRLRYTTLPIHRWSLSGLPRPTLMWRSCLSCRCIDEICSLHFPPPIDAPWSDAQRHSFITCDNFGRDVGGVV